jgi:hypothetical protein
MVITDGGETPVSVPSCASSVARAVAFSLAGPLLMKMMKLRWQPSVMGERYSAFSVGNDAPETPGSACGVSVLRRGSLVPS